MVRTPPAPAPGDRNIYRNPFRDVTGLRPERVDMGVDYGGSGPVHALGPGVITNLWNAGWGPPAGVAPGAFISERLSAGPLRGRYVYVAEGIEPSVQVGQKVTAGTVIGRATGGGIETGFAEPPGTGNALGASQFTGSNVTAYGEAYSDVLQSVGAPGGVITGPVSGSVPPWLAGALTGLGQLFGYTATAPGPRSGGISGAIEGLGRQISGITDFLHTADAAVTWLVNPSNWVRILADVAGGILVLGGIWTLSHVGGDLPLAGPVTKGAALPVGIFMVGAGGVLLFIGFHNLPADVTNITDLMRYLNENIKQPQGAGP